MVVTIAVEGVRVPGVTAELYSLDNNVVVAQTKSDGIGQVTFPDVPAGLYTVRAVRDGFADGESLPFGVRGGAVENVLMEMRLTFVRESVEVIAPTNSPTESLQPVAVSDVLSGAKMDIQPLAGDDFQSLLAVLPSIIRGPEGRLRVKGGAPTTGALQISSASLNDPSTGDFDLELPSGAVESVEVLSNPFAAEYGRFSTSVTQVRTKRGTNDWSVKADNLVPGFGKGFVFVNKFEPRLSISGPLKRDKLLLGQYFQYRFAKTEVRSLPDRPQLGLFSFDSFTRIDAVLSSRHALTGGVIYFPRKIENATLSTFRPPEATTQFTQEGFSAGLADRLILSANVVLETTVAARFFEIDQMPQGELTMVYAPQGQRGNYFSQQERDVRSVQAVEVLTVSKDGWLGQHVFKVGRRPPALALRRPGPQPRRGRRPARRFAGRAHGVPDPTGTTAGERDRVRAVRPGSLAAQRPPDARARRPRRSRRGRRKGQLLAARRRRAQPPARRPGHPARRDRQVRRAHAAHRRRVHAIRRADGAAFRSAGHAAGSADHDDPRPGRSAADAAEHRADRRLGSARRPALLLQGGLSQSQRIGGLRRRPGSRPGPADPRVERHLELLGDRRRPGGSWPASTATSACRTCTRTAPATSTTTTSFLATSAIRSSGATRTRSAPPTSRTG